VYEDGVLLNSGSGEWSMPGLNASGWWEAREGEAGSENVSCIEENTGPFREFWGVSKEKRELNQPMLASNGLRWRVWRILCQSIN
jgi:hypothetical protein